VHFATKERETFNIREFSWSRSEVSAAADLRKVVVWYVENEVPISFAPVPSPSEENLVPGKTHGSNVGLIQSIGGSTIGGKCWATLDYTVTYQLRTFLGAPEVRDHR
jgi:hypothetical protein